jgi:UrcA family protein
MYRNSIGRRAFRSAAGVALLLAATFTVIPANATAAAPVTRTVKVSDLNLASPQGQQTLARRLHAAIEQVCAPSAGENRLRVSRSKIEDCRQSAWADAQRQLQQHGLPTQFAASR